MNSEDLTGPMLDLDDLPVIGAAVAGSSTMVRRHEHASPVEHDTITESGLARQRDRVFDHEWSPRAARLGIRVR
jgi:hypothetical protein